MSQIEFGIVGAGWRAEFVLRIVKALPERFKISSVMVRDEKKAKALEKKWGVKTCSSIKDLLDQGNPSFVIVSVPWSATPVITKELVDKGMAVLSETPPAPDLKGLNDLYKLIGQGGKIQVAEQYHLQPLYAACLAVADSGKLGKISQVQLSVCHGYHGISLIRKFLGIHFENASITAQTFSTPLVQGPGRNGCPSEEKIINSEQEIAVINFGDQFAIYDFTSDQYFSWIRSLSFTARGEKGEIKDSRIKYLKDFKRPIEFDLLRKNAGENGNLEGFYLKGILAGEEWVYENPFIPGRLTDDEIAYASCIDKMAKYVNGGPEFYSLAEASQDHYLSLMIKKAIETKEVVKTQTQSWAVDY